MPCPACTTRILRIFFHDIPPRVTHRQLLNLPVRTSTSIRFASQSKYLQFQQTRLLTQNSSNRSSYGVAYSSRRLSDDDYLPFIQDIPPAEPQPPIALGRGDPRHRGGEEYPNGVAPAPPVSSELQYRVREGDEMVLHKPGFGRGHDVMEEESRMDRQRQDTAQSERSSAYEQDPPVARRHEEHRYGMRPDFDQSPRVSRNSTDIIGRESPKMHAHSPTSDSAIRQFPKPQHMEQRQSQYRSERDKLIAAMARIDDPQYLGEDVEPIPVKIARQDEHLADKSREQELGSQEQVQEPKQQEQIINQDETKAVITEAPLDLSPGATASLEHVPGARAISRLERKLRRQKLKEEEEAAAAAAAAAAQSPEITRALEEKRASKERRKLDKKAKRALKKQAKSEQAKSEQTKSESEALSGVKAKGKKDLERPESKFTKQPNKKAREMESLNEAMSHLGMPVIGMSAAKTKAAEIQNSRALSPEAETAPIVAVEKKADFMELENLQYANRWTLPPIKDPKLLAPSPRGRGFGRTSARDEWTPQVRAYKRVLASPREHPTWLVERAALALKLKGQNWCPPKRISPGTVMLIKSIAQQSPNLFTAAELAAKFKVTPEAVKRVLRSKWMPKEGSEDAEDRLRRWLKRGEVIRGAKIERGEIWTKEQRRKRYAKNVARQEFERLKEMFGPKPERRGWGRREYAEEAVEAEEEKAPPVTLGRISLSTKIL